MSEETDRAQNYTSTSLTDVPPRFTRQRSSVVLVVVGGPDAGRSVEVDADGVVLGSATDCDLPLTDATVSRQHLEATWRESSLELIDLGSKNGSFFAGSRFQKLELGCGAEFRIGNTALKAVPNEEALDPEQATGTVFGTMVGVSPVMRQLFTLVDQVAGSGASVLIEGETGVGKELVAEEIHRRSGRRDAPFTVFDCGVVPDELVESTLFGHVRGSFTGATSDKVGVLAEANGGTIFLDEIGELKLELQPALLRVLDRGVVRRVGASQYQPVDVRVVAATHRKLAQQINDGGFREDLYYRLAVVRLSVPPLRDRPGDIALLVRHFLRRLGRPDLEVSDRDIARLQSYPWPGNVRELRNAVHRGAVLAREGVLVIDSLEADTGETLAPAVAVMGRERIRPAASATTQQFRAAKAEAIELFESRYLTDLMGAHGTVRAAANAAGMDRKHLRVLLRRYGLHYVD